MLTSFRYCSLFCAVIRICSKTPGEEATSSGVFDSCACESAVMTASGNKLNLSVNVCFFIIFIPLFYRYKCQTQSLTLTPYPIKNRIKNKRFSIAW